MSASVGFRFAEAMSPGYWNGLGIGQGLCLFPVLSFCRVVFLCCCGINLGTATVLCNVYVAFPGLYRYQELLSRLLLRLGERDDSLPLSFFLLDN